ncbi:BglG family transcription antiterminator [Breznakia pachnodae]|uniref:Lichenan operon transcriptional antiterminator n=1 Tax=Breznakia pachnodae TaxID=265178 RepID=A0ABU0E8P5_9FIRM|nr:BglG family transcription antiterminator [Breznakia pachnodae]MDQ0363094.1 lichenan operon transcriptional antiterminator [Breznakia pachnodae]
MDKRWIQIIQLLYETDHSVTVKELSSKMQLSSKTIKNLININQSNCEEYGFSISYHLTKGYSINIQNENDFYNFFLKEHIASDEVENRINYMIGRLVENEDYIRIEDIADELFVSRATLDRLMPVVKEIVAKYDLTISKKPKYGIKLKGSEVNKRICYAHEVKSSKQNNNEEMTIKIQKILFDTIKKYDLILNDINFYNLVQHCVIAINRIKSDNVMEKQTFSDNQDNIEKEKQAAKEIVQKFENEFDIHIPNSEEHYIIMHLLGKRILIGQTISEDIFACIDDILEYIKQKENIDFNNDQELKTALALHIQPLLSRLKFGLKQENPNLTDIKREMSKGYELALCASTVIQDKYGLKSNEDEIAYLALHFAVALDKRKKPVIDKQIVVVCSSGRGTAKLLQHRLIDRYHFKPENLVLLSSFMLEDYDFSNTLCILTTIPLNIKTDISIIIIDMIFNERSAAKVDKAIQSLTLLEELSTMLNIKLFFKDVKLSSKEEVLEFLCNNIVSVYDDVDEDFYNQVMQREDSSSTEVGNLVAIPHPFNYQGYRVILSFISLKKPIKWKFGEVQLVILMALPNEDLLILNEISDLITSIVSDINKVNALISDTSLDKFIEIIKGGE